MFGRDKDPQPLTPPPSAEPAKELRHAVDDPGKGRPTPKRKEAEAANRRPLVPDDRKAAAKVERAKAREQRDREYQAMQTGDERYMPVKDRGPVRRYVRDHVDARRNLGELFLPVAFVFLLLQFFVAKSSPVLAFAALIVLYVYITATVLDGWLMWRGLKKRLVAKFGTAATQRGLTMYAVTRAFQIRRARLPKPLVKHGQYPV
ncbi:DUF3043 domain-containing protein [Cellulomonas soli]|uniref:DUF3043 domain-containing protein n=1 Tax=Cellulomonas soli TaxID=931535 RepID=A0A512P9P0_9CELL|nr:DUF3043 domain-containing protein [Cellulomonas soli]NYI60410.1 hypothetical protein [Cellulomonas soli]GEP67923.1 hypothetical protein CSO01_06380 [Cellulomonas soli]